MGRHGRPEPDALAGVDVAAELESGPVIDVAPSADVTPGPGVAPINHGHGHRRSPASEAAEQPAAQVRYVADPARAMLVGSTVVARRDRQAERKARRAANRRRIMIIGSAVLAVLLVIGVTVVVVSSRGGDPPVTAAPKTPHQSTLLVQAAGPDGTAVASALVGVTPSTGEGTALLIPAGLIVDDASSGSLPFGETLTLPSKDAPANALVDLLGVKVNDSWVLSPQGLAALVDKVGGVQATVDVDVIAKNAKGDEVVVVRAGSQRLKGSQAAAYATYLAEGEPETVRLARFNSVFDQVLRALPSSEAGIAATLTALSTGSTSSLKPPQLAGLLSVLRKAAVKEALHYDVLPVSDIDTGDTVATYGLDSGKAGVLLQSEFAGSLQKDRTGDTVRVLVENGVGTPDLLISARAKLVADGFQFITGGNASDFQAKTPSVVYVKDGSAKSEARGVRVAKSLGLPASSIALNTRGQTVADVIVILGPDFKP